MEKQSKLSPPKVYDGGSVEEMFNAGMDHFYNIFLKKDVKPKFNGKDVFFDMEKMYRRMFKMPYPLSFMHITSLNNEEKYTLFPCVNDLSYELCEGKCDLRFAQNSYKTYGRWDCLYRLHRIHWIPEIFALANARDSNVQITSKTKDDGREIYTNINIRYCCGMDDYLIVLKERKRSGDYLLITAFPVVTKRKKRRA